MAEGTNREASFGQFISGFAYQTLVHLGQMPNPMTEETGVDLVNAKYSIDLLGIMQEKTKGNLTPEEDLQLSGLLRDLRLAFVEASRKKGAGESGGSGTSSGPAEG